MISNGQIVAAGAITGLAVFVAGWRFGWSSAALLTAGVAAFGLIVGWRWLANGLGLNSDFLPTVSVGDTGCLVAGLLGPFAVAAWGRVPRDRRWLPAFVGALVGFVVNVVIL